MAKIAIYNITNTLKRGGVETCLWEVAKKFDAWGHEVTVLGGEGTVRPMGNIENIKIATFDYTPRKKIVNLGSRFRKIGERASFASNAWSTLKNGYFDGIILGKPYDIPVALLARRSTGSKVAYFSGGGEYFPGYAFFVKRLDYFCACSRFDCEDIYKYCGVRPEANNYGVDTNLFRPLPFDLQMAQRLGIEPEKDAIVATAVRLVAFKGIDIGLRALAILLRHNPRIKYLIAGDGPEKNKLIEMARAMNVEQAIIFCGELSHSELPSFYSLADVAIFPSFMETFGVAVGEAMACGVPIIASNVGGIPEQVAAGTGTLVNPKDEVVLAKAIAEMLSNVERRRVGERAREYAVKNLDWNLCASKLLTGLLAK